MRYISRSAVLKVLREEKAGWTAERRDSKRGTPYHEACRAAETALKAAIDRVKEVLDELAE